MQLTTAPVATTQRTTIVAQSPAGHQLPAALAEREALALVLETHQLGGGGGQ